MAKLSIEEQKKLIADNYVKMINVYTLVSQSKDPWSQFDIIDKLGAETLKLLKKYPKVKEAKLVSGRTWDEEINSILRRAGSRKTAFGTREEWEQWRTSQAPEVGLTKEVSPREKPTKEIARGLLGRGLGAEPLPTGPELPRGFGFKTKIK